MVGIYMKKSNQGQFFLYYYFYSYSIEFVSRTKPKSFCYKYTRTIISAHEKQASIIRKKSVKQKKQILQKKKILILHLVYVVQAIQEHRVKDELYKEESESIFEEYKTSQISGILFANEQMQNPMKLELLRRNSLKMEQFYTPMTQMFMPYPLYTNYQFALPISMFQPNMDLLLYSSCQEPQPLFYNFNYEKIQQDLSSDIPKTVSNRKYSSEQSKKSLNDSKEEVTKEVKNKQKETYTEVTNRNILPNNLNLILSFIRRINKSGKYVERIIQKLKGDENFTTKKFYAYQSYLKQIIPFHKNRHTLKRLTQHTDVNYNIYTLAQQKFYNKVCRILIDQFLKGEYLTNMLISSKIQRTSKKQHLKIRRYLLNKLQGELNKDELYQDQLIE